MNIKIIPDNTVSVKLNQTPDNTVPVKLNRVTKPGKPGVQRVLRNGVLLPEVDISVPEKLSELENDLNLNALLPIDDALSATSKNPVQNKVVTVKYTELNNQIHDIQHEMTTLSNSELEEMLK